MEQGVQPLLERPGSEPEGLKRASRVETLRTKQARYLVGAAVVAEVLLPVPGQPFARRPHRRRHRLLAERRAKDGVGRFREVARAADLDGALEWGRKLATVLSDGVDSLPIEVRPFQDPAEDR